MRPWLFVSLVPFVIACDAPPAPPPSGVLVVPPLVDSELYTTIVTMEGEQMRISYEPLSVDERPNRDRGASVVVQDTNCSWDSLWLYDRENAAGNRICFAWSLPDSWGPALLSNIPRRWGRIGYGYPLEVLAYWDIAGGSVWPGANAGSLTNHAGTVDASIPIAIPFESWGPIHSFELTPNRITSVHLY